MENVPATVEEKSSASSVPSAGGKDQAGDVQPALHMPEPLSITYQKKASVDNLEIGPLRLLDRPDLEAGHVRGQRLLLPLRGVVGWVCA